MAAKIVSKVIQQSRWRITRSLNKNASDFRRCIKLGERWSCTSPESQNKLLATDNAGDNIYERMHVADIRWLCKEDQTPYEVSKLFNRFLNLPDQYRTESVNSALYWFLYYDKIEEALELKTLMEEHGISKNYSTYSTLAVLYSRCSHLGNMMDFFNEMTREGLTPRARHYTPFIKTAAEKGDVIGAFHSMSEMQQSAVAHERNTDIYTSLIRGCVGQQNKKLTSKVLETLHDFRKYRDLLNNDTLDAIKLWFDR